MFEKTGCLISTDESADKKIQFEGLPNYIILPPIALDPDTTMASAPTPTEVPKKRYDMIYDDFEVDEEGRDVKLTIDNEVDEDRWIFDLHCWNMYLGFLTLKKNSIWKFDAWSFLVSFLFFHPILRVNPKKPGFL